MHIQTVEDFELDSFTDLRAKALFSDADTALLERFKKFHKENPLVFQLFKTFSFEAKKAGRKRFSHWMIANRIRWYTTVETIGDDYKLSNDYIALYARLLIYHYPEFDGFFTIKPMKPFRPSVRREPKQ